MAGLLDILLQTPGPEERLMQIMPMLQQGQGLRPSGPGGMGGGGGGSMGAGTAPHQLALNIARWIERKPGFQVGGLHGFQGQGPITSGHIENSQHYGKGFAGDVGYYGGGRFGSEGAALDWLERAMQRRYGDALTELIWREPDHYDHLHYGTRPGG